MSKPKQSAAWFPDSAPPFLSTPDPRYPRLMPKPTDPSGFSRAEIAAVALGLAVPVGLFALLLIPGAMAAVIAFLTQRSVAPFAFGGAAAVVAAVLAARIWTRVRRRRATPEAPKRSSAFWDLWRGPDR